MKYLKLLFYCTQSSKANKLHKNLCHFAPYASLRETFLLMTENEISRIVVDICFHIHKQYGPGLFESVYEEIICYELTENNISFKRQQAIPVIHKKIKMEIGFRADIIIEDKVILELK